MSTSMQTTYRTGRMALREDFFGHLVLVAEVLHRAEGGGYRALWVDATPADVAPLDEITINPHLS